MLNGQHEVVGDVAKEPETDAELMRRSREEPRAFAAVFDRHFVTIHGYLARRVGPDVADDLAGEVFRIAFERRRAFDMSHDSSRPWLYGIATNLLHAQRRHEERRLRALQRLAARVGAEPGGDVFSASDERADADAEAHRVGPALAQLARGERDALLLFAVEGLTYREVAAALEVPLGTVRSRINRARARLRELLDTAGQQVDDRTEVEGGRDG